MKYAEEMVGRGIRVRKTEEFIAAPRASIYRRSSIINETSQSSWMKGGH